MSEVKLKKREESKVKGDKHLEGGGEEEAGREKKHLDQCNPRQDVAHADAFFRNGTHTVCFLDADSAPLGFAGPQSRSSGTLVFASNAKRAFKTHAHTHTHPFTRIGILCVLFLSGGRDKSRRGRLTF